MTAGWSRRRFLETAGSAMAGAALVSFGGARAKDLTAVRVQYDWLMGNGQLGDVVAQKKGFYAEQGLDVTFGPGGPNAQTVPPVLSGQAQCGQLSTTNQFFEAADAGRPLKLFACGFQRSPSSYISLSRSPIRTAADFAGKTIAVNPNGRSGLNLVLKKNRIDPASVKVVTMGVDMAPLISGQVDAVTAFVTNTKALSVLGSDMIAVSYDDLGVPGYANPYFTSIDVFDGQKDMLVRFLRATAKGWAWAHDNRRAAVDVMCDANPSLDREIEYRTVDLIMSLSFDATTREHGWGWQSREKLTMQLEQLNDAGKFTGKVPVLDECASWEILESSSDARPKVG